MKHGYDGFMITTSKILKLFVLVPMLCVFGCVQSSAFSDDLKAVVFSDAGTVFFIDPENTLVEFNVGNMGGRFVAVDGRLHQLDSSTIPTPSQTSSVETASDGAPDEMHFRLDVTIATGSVDMRNPLIESMLRGKDWFDSKTHPIARFESADVKWPQSDDAAQGCVGDLESDQATPDAAEVVDEAAHETVEEITEAIDEVETGALCLAGNLTIKEITHPLFLSVSFPDGVTEGPEFLANAPFTATAKFSRGSFGMTAMPNMAADEIRLNIAGVITDGTKTLAP